jgi:signal transduction histidine kinase
MADAAPPEEPHSPPERRFNWVQGLSARLLLLTMLMVVVANLVVLPPSLAADEQSWLLDRLRLAELATLVEETAPGGVVTDRARSDILASAGVVSVAFQIRGERRLILQAPRLARAPYLLDLRGGGPMSWAAPFESLLNGGDRMVRVMAKPRFRPGAFVEVVLPDAPLRRELLDQLGRLVVETLFTSLLAGAVVYIALTLFLVRPMQRITRSMERFRADPTDPRASLPPSGRQDEIGRAEVELDRMQADLRAALASRARLAALGAAVAKINHDLRNMLTSAQIASERLAGSGDPQVAQALPRLERALDRAITLASNVLTFGKSEEPPPQTQTVPLLAALEEAALDAGLTASGVKLETAIDPAAQVLADPEQLYRILVNLLRNARQAIEAQVPPYPTGRVLATFSESPGESRLRLADNGPGLPERVRQRLFQPFAGSGRPEGAGLGLAIARELAQGHGGDVTLASSGPGGAVFELWLPRA